MSGAAGGFRAELVALRQEKERQADADPAERALVLKLLDRWIDRRDSETIWITIIEALRASKVAPVPPREFIAGVLQSRLAVARASAVEKQSRAVAADVLRRADLDWKGDRIKEAVEKKTQVRRFQEQEKALLGRKRKGALQKRFMVLWRKNFIEHCGAPLDGVVAALTEIAFGGNVTIDMVRGAMRPARRDIRRQK